MADIQLIKCKKIDRKRRNRKKTLHSNGKSGSAKQMAVYKFTPEVHK